MYKIICKNIDETRSFGKKLGELVKKGMVFTLTGDLGAGKTSLTQGIAKGLDIKKTINSPTFNILKIYSGRLTLNHIDAYRLEGLHQDLGFEEQIDDDGLTVIEWPNYIIELIGNEYLEIVINIIENNYREITLIPHGRKYEDMLGDLK